MPPTPAPAKGGNILTRKFGPLPGWAWAAIGVAGFFIYKQRKASEAATAAASTASGTSVAPITSTAATSPLAEAPSGYGYQGPGRGFREDRDQCRPAATTSTSTGATTSVQGTSLNGVGTYTPTGASYGQLNASGLANQTSTTRHRVNRVSTCP